MAKAVAAKRPKKRSTEVSINGVFIGGTPGRAGCSGNENANKQGDHEQAEDDHPRSAVDVVDFASERFLERIPPGHAASPGHPGQNSANYRGPAEGDEAGGRGDERAEGDGQHTGQNDQPESKPVWDPPEEIAEDSLFHGVRPGSFV